MSDKFKPGDLVIGVRTGGKGHDIGVVQGRTYTVVEGPTNGNRLVWVTGPDLTEAAEFFADRFKLAKESECAKQEEPEPISITFAEERRADFGFTLGRLLQFQSFFLRVTTNSNPAGVYEISDATCSEEYRGYPVVQGRLREADGSKGEPVFILVSTITNVHVYAIGEPS